jgi:hypothetical protein
MKFLKPGHSETCWHPSFAILGFTIEKFDTLTHTKKRICFRISFGSLKNLHKTVVLNLFCGDTHFENEKMATQIEYPNYNWQITFIKKSSKLRVWNYYATQKKGYATPWLRTTGISSHSNTSQFFLVFCQFPSPHVIFANFLYMIYCFFALEHVVIHKSIENKSDTL